MLSFLIFLVVLLALSFILLGLNGLVSPSFVYLAKNSIYECGFEANNQQTREKFTIYHYIVGIFFLGLDVEILCLLPAGVTLGNLGSFGFYIILIFLLVLTIGFAVEISSKAINILNKEEDNTNTFDLYINSNFYQNYNLSK